MELGPGSVLLIDNEPMWLRRLEAALTAAGFGEVVAIDSFSDAEKALTRLDLMRFDFAVLDIRMRKHLFDQGGLYLLDLLKARRPPIPVLMLSAFFDDYPGLAIATGRYKKVLIREKEEFLRSTIDVIRLLLEGGDKVPVDPNDGVKMIATSSDRSGDTKPITGKTIKILFLASDPFKQDALSLDREVREITSKIRSTDHRDTLNLISSWAVSPDDIQELLLHHRPDIVHFSGHGTRAEQLVLTDRDGRPRPVSKEAIVDLFEVLKDNVRLVVLNACHTKPQAEAIAQVLGCSVGMNAAIGDAAAIVFAAAFYRALGFGRDVRTAFRLGLNALKLEEIPEDLTPELFTRAGGKDPAEHLFARTNHVRQVE